jgi:hypothetical protein
MLDPHLFRNVVHNMKNIFLKFKILFLAMTLSVNAYFVSATEQNQEQIVAETEYRQWVNRAALYTAPSNAKPGLVEPVSVSYPDFCVTLQWSEPVNVDLFIENQDGTACEVVGAERGPAEELFHPNSLEGLENDKMYFVAVELQPGETGDAHANAMLTFSLPNRVILKQAIELSEKEERVFWVAASVNRETAEVTTIERFDTSLSSYHQRVGYVYPEPSEPEADDWGDYLE